MTRTMPLFGLPMKLTNFVPTFVLAAALIPMMVRAATPASAPESPFAPELKEFVDNFKPNTRAVAYGQQQIHPPQEAVRLLDTPEGYRVELAAHEPQIRQP